MADLATYCGVTPRSINLPNTAVVRGVRVIRASTGLNAVADATQRGDYVTLAAGAALENGVLAVSMADGGKVPALASEACAVGDAAYAAAAGKFSKTSTNAAVCGRWTLAASGDGALGEVELLSVL
jgi:hypothetical protein